MPALHAPGWPVVLYDQASGVLLRAYRRSDASAWSRSRIANPLELLVLHEPQQLRLQR